MLKKIGTMKISRKTSALVNAWAEVDRVEHAIATNGRDVYEADDLDLQALGLGGLPKEVPIPEHHNGAPQLLAFRAVENKVDWEWQSIG